MQQKSGYTTVRRESDEVIHPSCLVPTIQPVEAVICPGVAAVGQVLVQQHYVPKNEVS